MARRLLTVVSFSASIGLMLLTSDALGGATVDLLFVGINGSPIPATDTIDGGIPFFGGGNLTMAVVLRNDIPLTVASFSLRYDLDGDDELDVLSAIQWIGVPISSTQFFTPLAPLQPSTATFVGSFQGVTSDIVTPTPLPAAAGAFAGGYQMGTVVWKVNAGVNSDGADILSGILNAGIDVFTDALKTNMNARVRFNAATVNIPEPGTASLLGLALLGLVLARRRRRS